MQVTVNPDISVDMLIVSNDASYTATLTASDAFALNHAIRAAKRFAAEIKRSRRGCIEVHMGKYLPVTPDQVQIRAAEDCRMSFLGDIQDFMGFKKAAVKAQDNIDAVFDNKCRSAMLSRLIDRFKAAYYRTT